MERFRLGDLVICINPGLCDLTEGRIYRVIDIVGINDNADIYVKNDIHNTFGYFGYRFKSVSLNEIL